MDTIASRQRVWRCRDLWTQRTKSFWGIGCDKDIILRNFGVYILRIYNQSNQLYLRVGILDSSVDNTDVFVSGSFLLIFLWQILNM
jgi:hypothetical protein